MMICLLLAGCAEKEAGRMPSAEVSGQTAQPAVNAPLCAEAEPLLTQARSLWNVDDCTRPRDVLELLNRVLTLAPRCGEALAMRGMVRSQLGEREQAFDDLTAALLSAPSPRLYAWRALTSLRHGLGAAARRDAEYALRKEPEQPEALGVLGMLALGEGRNDEACAAFARACAGGQCRPLEDARKKGICK